MGKKISFTVAGRIYPTKGELRKRVQAILRTAIPGEPLEGHDAEIAEWLLENHYHYEEKVGKRRVAYYFVDLNPLNRQEKQFRVRFTNGGWTDFSYMSALGQDISKMSMPAAGRVAVDGDIAVFKGSVAKCACGAKRGLHVHHAAPAFREIMADFVEGVGDADLLATDKNGFIERAVSEAFRLYHKERANLVVLCEDCHAKVHYGEKAA